MCTNYELLRIDLRLHEILLVNYVYKYSYLTSLSQLEGFVCRDVVFNSAGAHLRRGSGKEGERARNGWVGNREIRTGNTP